MEWYGICISIGIILVYFFNVLDLKFKNILIDINQLLIIVYCSAFLGGKLVYLLFDSNFMFSNSSLLDLLLGGFSLLGASFFGLFGLLYLVNKNTLGLILSSFLPVSLLLLHVFGRLGCFFSDCCGGNFYTFNLHFVSIFFYFFSFIIGYFLYFFHYLKSFYNGLYYYGVIIFLERFLFDIYRYDSIMVNIFFTKYQLLSLLYLFLSFIVIYIFYKINNLK